MSSLNDWEKENTLIVAPDALPPSGKQSDGHSVVGDNDQRPDKLTETQWASGGSSEGWLEVVNHTADENPESLYDQLLQFTFPDKSHDTADILAQSYERVAQWIPGAVNSQDGETISPFETSETIPLNDYGAEVWNTQFPPSYYPCPECLSYECPNVTGEYDCPYATVYEVSESARYDPYVRYGYGYEHLPRSSNPRGWTFENTGGCRLYSLGLKSLAPINEGTEALDGVQDIELQVLGGRDKLEV